MSLGILLEDGNVHSYECTTCLLFPFQSFEMAKRGGIVCCRKSRSLGIKVTRKYYKYKILHLLGVLAVNTVKVSSSAKTKSLRRRKKRGTNTPPVSFSQVNLINLGFSGQFSGKRTAIIMPLGRSVFSRIKIPELSSDLPPPMSP